MSRGVTVDFNANVARFTSGIDKATNDLNRFQSNASRIGKDIQSILGGIGIGLSVKGVISFADDIITGLDKLNDLSKTTGVTVERLSGLSVAAKQSGTDIEGVAQSIAKLSVNIGKDSQLFKEFGITATDGFEAFLQLSDIFVAIEDPTKRAAVAAVALGKAWQSSAPLLSEGSVRLREMVDAGQAATGVTKEMAQAADNLKDKMALLSAQFSGFGVSVMTNLVGPMTDFFTLMNNFARGDTVDSLTVKLEKLRSTRADLMKPTMGNKINNFLFSDVADLDKQIADTERKLAYVKRLNAAVKVETFKQPVKVNTNSPSLDAINKFVGDDEAQKKATAAAAKAAKEREKIFKESLDWESKQADLYYADREKKARDAAEALKRLSDEGQALTFSVDPLANLTHELERYKELLDAGAISQETFNKAATRAALDAEKALKGTTDDMTALMIGFQTNIQRTMGEGLYQMMKGNFENIGSAFADMLTRMLADIAAAQLSKALFGGDGTGGWFGAGMSMVGSLLGGLGGIMGGVGGGGGSSLTGSFPAFNFASRGAVFDQNTQFFANGGIVMQRTPFQFSRGGTMQSGVMGETGPEAIMPLKRTPGGKLGIEGSGGGMSVNYAPTINIDSRTDRNDVHAIVQRAVKKGNADLVEKLERGGRI